MVKKTQMLTVLDITKRAVPLLKKNGVVKAGIFGSYARGEAKRGSDVDLLVQIRGKKSLLDIVGMQLDLEQKLHHNVDLVEYSELHPRLKKQILNEEIRIL